MQAVWHKAAAAVSVVPVVVLRPDLSFTHVFCSHPLSVGMLTVTVSPWGILATGMEMYVYVV